MRRLSTILLFILFALSVVVGLITWLRPLPPITGRVVALDGAPVVGAVVEGGGEVATSDGNGWFTLPGRSGALWVTVKHPQFLSRTRAAAPGAPVLLRLTPDDGKTIALTFGGDTMFGRRFYDRNGDGDTADGLLKPGAGVADHLALLRHIQPLLANADLTAVNLESILFDQAFIDPTKPRPAAFHPDKEFVFASAPTAAGALKEAGVDLVDLGNNHLYDAREAGVSSTRAALDGVGLAHFGAGLSEAEAWTPAVRSVRGQSLAFLGCTSITGLVEEDNSYVASDRDGRGGAANCDVERIHAAVRAARAQGSTVVFMIHGGYEYGRAPSPNLLTFTRAAREAGATLVINHHPHVVGGLEWDGSALVAWSLGNFLFDQSVWPTYESYLLTVHLREGEVVRAYAEPFAIDGFLPRGLFGARADYVARGAAGRVPGPFLIEDGAVEIDLAGRGSFENVSKSLSAQANGGDIVHLQRGWWLSDFAGAGQVRLGRDLLWAGSFEDEDVDDEGQEGDLWALAGTTARLGRGYAYAGAAGVRLERDAGDEQDSILTHQQRIPVVPGEQLSLAGMVRASGSAAVRLQVSWYNATTGPSASQQVVAIAEGGGGEWEPFRLDVTVPPGAVAVGVFVRLAPPRFGTVSADLDDINLVAWAAPDAPFSRQYDHLLVVGSGTATLSKDRLPGGEAWVGTPALVHHKGTEDTK